jgi:alkylhydroperoxidase family enzyme
MHTERLTEERPLIAPVPPAGEEDRVTQVFDAVAQQIGFVPDGLRLYGISPPLLEAFVANVGYFRGGTSLSPTLTAMIRYLGSWRAGCQFCVDLNEALLTDLGADLDVLRAARDDAGLAPVEERERPLLRLALKAQDAPHEVTREDLDAARAQGFSDREAFDAVVQAANNRAFNLVLRTFNVEHQGAFA